MTALYFVPLEVHGFKTHTEQFITAKGHCIKKLATELKFMDLFLFVFHKQKFLLQCCLRKV